ncbi:MAG: hypothetical protein BGO49_28155 [Planctomycetales bacterium 71-10]|nr:MAG: hypothetical protein BGO49_28155 [Planctomycetales bacterium 71-10]
MADAPPPRFALLEHTWDGVHYDFLLEREGVLKTWALDGVPAGGVERIARPLPDHRLIYLDYEGPISGDRGSVRRVDGGEYEAVEWGDGRIRVRLRGRQLVGEALLTRRPLGDDAGPYWKISLGNVD